MTFSQERVHTGDCSLHRQGRRDLLPQQASPGGGRRGRPRTRPCASVSDSRKRKVLSRRPVHTPFTWPATPNCRTTSYFTLAWLSMPTSARSCQWPLTESSHSIMMPWTDLNLNHESQKAVLPGCTAEIFIQGSFSVVKKWGGLNTEGNLRISPTQGL